MRSQAYFRNIRTHLLEEINAANQQIIVAVAWFTDKKLFNELIAKCADGLEVQLMIADDDINRQYGPDFEELRSAGGTLILVDAPEPETLMHNKFCVIDGKTVITGSYNWSKKAAQNHENITITWDYPGLAIQFLVEFDRLKARYATQKSSVKKPFDYGKVNQRLRMVQSLIHLEEFQEIALQLDRLNEYELIPEVEHIVDLVRLSSYAQALAAIEQLQNNYTRIISIDADRIESLRLQLIYLQTELISLQEYHDSLDREIGQLHRQIHIRLGGLILKLLDLKIVWNKIREKLGKTFQYEDLKQEYQQFADELNQIKANPQVELTEDEQEDIKELYKRGVRLCHPDKVEERFKQKANEIFIRLKKAFDQNNLPEVKHIAQALEMGVWDLGEEKQDVKEVDKLEALVQGLKLKVVELKQKIDLLAQDDDYQEKLRYEDLDQFIQAKEVMLKREIVTYQNKITEHTNEQSTATN